MEITFLNLFVLASAVWRLSSLFANENGPFGMFNRIRCRVKVLEGRSRIVSEFHLHEGLTCEWCNSLWFGTVLFLMWFLFGKVILLLILPLSLSAWVIFMKYSLQVLQGADKRLNGVVDDPEPAPELMPAVSKAYSKEGVTV